MDATDLILARVADWLADYGGRSVDVANLLCDRHAGDPERIAAICEDGAGHTTRLTFAQLQEHSSRFAGVLRASGWKFDRWLDTVLMQRELGDADRRPPEPGR